MPRKYTCSLCEQEGHSSAKCPNVTYEVVLNDRKIKYKTPEERIEKRIKVEKSSCWIWQACVVSGFGMLTIGQKRYLAHRYAFEIYSGRKIPRTYHVRQICGNKLCTNPEHLELAKGASRIVKGEEHGGAKLTDENVKEIRVAYGSGEHTAPELAQQYQIGISTVYSVIAKRTWKHIA
tara:strand:- start:994 stop:1527 length:534 start_codon:yes stop_codon:yes gene_type:complete